MPITAISLFSGCGGDTLGLERAGIVVNAFNEFKQSAINSHVANFVHSVLLNDATVRTSDITKIPDNIFMAYNGKTDIVFAGFPCQGFSRAGKKNAMDPRNQMFLQFVRVVRLIRPRFIIGENVTGLLSMKSGSKETDPLMLDLIIKAFKDIGYEVTYKVLEASNFGVPQKRKRVLLVGWTVDGGIPALDPASFWAAVSEKGARMPRIRLSSFITNSMEGAYLIPTTTIPDNFHRYALKVAQDSIPLENPHPYVVIKTNLNLLSCSKRISPIHSEIIDLNSPSKTIICTYNHQPRLLVGLQKPDGTAYCRALLPNELKQIQGFPANFIVTGNKKEQITQIGNAVPPAIIQAIGETLVGIHAT
jgi:DNA (cytosine-5)-methyltransferase 1